MSQLPTDITTRIAFDFPDSDERDLVEQLLSALSANMTDRVIRCVLFVANGDLNRLGQLEQLARIDNRDVIVRAEYEPNSDVKIRDFNQPFQLLQK